MNLIHQKRSKHKTKQVSICIFQQFPNVSLLLRGVAGVTRSVFKEHPVTFAATDIFNSLLLHM